VESTTPLIREATDDDLALVRELFWEYLQWANDRVNEEFSVDFDIASMLDQDMVTLEKFAPPTGRLLLATISDHVVGIGCLKRLLPDVGEIKRMYVRPESRGTGLGRALLEALISSAKVVGYSRIRLDSAGFMKAAHALYRSADFRKIEPYPESEIPPEFHEHWVFMERELEGLPS
jgi:GNAT superfamily N-acetyltransferase